MREGFAPHGNLLLAFSLEAVVHKHYLPGKEWVLQLNWKDVKSIHGNTQMMRSPNNGT